MRFLPPTEEPPLDSSTGKMKATVFILKKVKYGESDLILHALTASGAKAHFIAKGALVSKRRFGGGILEPTHCLTVTYRDRASGNESELKVLQEAHLVEDFKDIRTSYERLKVAFEFLELVQKFAQEGDEHSKDLFDLLGNALRILQKTDALEILRLHFQIKLLAQQGVLPHDLPNLEVFRRPIREHSFIGLSSEERQALISRVSYLVKNYQESRV